MSQRESNLLWLKDTLHQVMASCQRLEWAEDANAIQVLTETMLRDLEACRRLCQALQGRDRRRHRP